MYRRPFPGPGLAIRIIGAVSPEKLEILKNADAMTADWARLPYEVLARIRPEKGDKNSRVLPSVRKRNE